MIEAEAQAEIYRIMCTQQWRPKSTNFGQTKKPQDMEHEPILQDVSVKYFHFQLNSALATANLFI